MPDFAPSDFEPAFSLSGIVLHVGEGILLLKRADTESYGGYWGLPAGRHNFRESPAEAAARELFEETGVSLAVEDLEFIHSFDVRYPEYDFDYHVFRAFVDELPPIDLDVAEHSAHRVVSLDQALRMDLVPGEEFCLRAYIDRCY